VPSGPKVEALAAAAAGAAEAAGAIWNEAPVAAIPTAAVTARERRSARVRRVDGVAEVMRDMAVSFDRRAE
jgi:hypothetical protein